MIQAGVGTVQPGGSFQGAGAASASFRPGSAGGMCLGLTCMRQKTLHTHFLCRNLPCMTHHEMNRHHPDAMCEPLCIPAHAQHSCDASRRLSSLLIAPAARVAQDRPRHDVCITFAFQFHFGCSMKLATFVVIHILFQCFLCHVISPPGIVLCKELLISEFERG